MPKAPRSVTTHMNDKRVVRAQEKLNRQDAKQAKAVTAGIRKAASKIKGQAGAWKGGPV